MKTTTTTKTTHYEIQNKRRESLLDEWKGYHKNVLKRKDVVLSPHLGFVNDPVFAKFGPDVVENLLNWLEGRPLVRLQTG